MSATPNKIGLLQLQYLIEHLNELEGTNYKDLTSALTSLVPAANFSRYAVLDASNEKLSVKNIDNKAIKSIEIADGVEVIGAEAFKNCTELTDIAFPSSITYIDKDAFASCSSIKNIYISDLASWCSIDVNASGYYSHPSGGYYNLSINLYLNGNLVEDLSALTNVTEIGEYAFYNCSSLKSIIIPEGVEHINSYAFQDCINAKSVFIPASLSKYRLTTNPFSGCSSLESITVADDHPFYYSQDNCLIYGREKELLSGCKNSIIPTDGSVTTIGYGAFNGCTGLTSIIIPNGVTSIDHYAFAYCTNLTSVMIPNSVTSIGKDAFYDCNSLTSITIPDGVTSIDEYTFNSCSALSSIAIPKSVTSIGRYAFSEPVSGFMSIEFEGTVYDWNTKVTKDPSWISHYTKKNYVISCYDGRIKPDGTTTYYSVFTVTNENRNKIGYKGTANEDLIIPRAFEDNGSWCSVSTIGGTAFLGCSNLKSISIPNTVTKIYPEAFANCTNLQTITIPKSVFEIGFNTFYNCSSLTSITLSGNITTLEDMLFDSCSNLTTITLPGTISQIGYTPFANCSKLSTIYFNGTMAKWKNIACDEYAPPYNNNTGNYIVVCVNGTVDRDGNTIL